MRAQNPNSMVVGRHYYDGSEAPMPGGYSESETFSIGIFKAVLTAKGDRCKRGKVLYRVRGKVADAAKVFARATEICAMMNNETWTGTKKSEIVK